mmetsp:Transcript_38802/g.128474  ORF Transcript_38802/g.128474 Transcript_38802/m.128474 type:complete len:269 (-) Transcript_38802:160-966(-)
MTGAVRQRSRGGGATGEGRAAASPDVGRRRRRAERDALGRRRLEPSSQRRLRCVRGTAGRRDGHSPWSSRCRRCYCGCRCRRSIAFPRRCSRVALPRALQHQRGERRRGGADVGRDGPSRGDRGQHLHLHVPLVEGRVHVRAEARVDHLLHRRHVDGGLEDRHEQHRRTRSPRPAEALPPPLEVDTAAASHAQRGVLQLWLRPSRRRDYRHPRRPQKVPREGPPRLVDPLSAPHLPSALEEPHRGGDGQNSHGAPEHHAADRNHDNGR